MATTTRIPVIALDYAEKDKAMLKELMVDYTDGNIYVVSATDKTVIFNVTEKIIEQIDDLNAENIEVDIDGIGIVNLTTFLNQLNTDIANTVHVKDPGEEFSYIINDNTIDNKSLKIFNGNIQLDAYLNADLLSIPQKTGLGLRWMPMTELISGLGSGSGSSGFNEVDGDLKVVPVILNSNNKIYLSSHAQKSYNVTGGFATIFLPSTEDEYSIVKWKLDQMESDLELILDDKVFTSRLISSNTNIIITNNSPGVKLFVPKCTDALKVSYRFSFETFDNGKTWILDITQYNNSSMY